MLICKGKHHNQKCTNNKINEFILDGNRRTKSKGDLKRIKCKICLSVFTISINEYLDFISARNT